MCERTGKWVVLRQDLCGAVRLVPVDCGDPLCPDCERMRAREIQARWGPVIERMRFPVMLTPTLRKDKSDLRDRIKFYHESMRRLWDTRLGPRNRPRFLVMAQEWTRTHLAGLVEDGTITSVEAEYRLNNWLKALDQFDKKLAKIGAPRLRDMLGEGVALFECTWKNDDFTPHRHLVIDTGYIPQPYLVILWKVATRGAGEVIDVRHLEKTQKDLQEVFKYLTKSWEIPEDRKKEFRDAVRGLKRVWPLGGAKPVEVDKPCPCCGEVSCRPHLAGMGEHVTRMKVLGLDVRKVMPSDDPGDLARWFYLEGRTWREMEPEVVDLILREIACHSPAGPPQQTTLTGWLAGAAG